MTTRSLDHLIGLSSPERAEIEDRIEVFEAIWQRGEFPAIAEPYRICGVLLTAGLLSVLSFGDVIRELLRQTPPDLGTSLLAGALIAVVGIGAILLADGFVFKRKGAGANDSRFVGIVQRQWFTIALMLLMAGLCIWVGEFGAHASHADRFGTGLDRWTAAVAMPTIAINGALIAFAIWLIRAGLREDLGRLFGAGVLLFLLWAVFRYIDLFAGIGGMLGASLLFFLCGAALFGMARFWTQRREASHV
jgi:hypothetical protein